MIPVHGGDVTAEAGPAAPTENAGLLALLQDELKDAEEYTDVLIGEERALALDYYLGRPMGDERDGRSKVISREVYKVVEGVSTAIANIYATAKSAVEFTPRKAEDVEKAEQRTAAVEYVFYSQNNGFLALIESIKDGVQSKAGFLTWRWEKDRRLTEERYRNQTVESLALLMQDNPTLRLVSVNPGEGTQGPDGAPVPTFDVVVHKTDEQGSVVVESVPPEEVLVTSRARSADVRKAPTIHWRSYKTRNELLKCGYAPEMVDALSYNTTRDAERMTQRRIDEVADTGDEAEVITTWIETDSDGDGIVELHRVVWSDQTIFEDAITDEVNLSAWTPNIQPHEFFGRSPADDAVESQQVMTVIKRQTLDNLYLANNPMWRVDTGARGVMIEDFYSPEIGRPLRAPKDAAEAITFPFVAQHSFPMLEYEQADTENKTGFTRYAQGMDAKSLNQTARGISIISNMSQQRVQLMARIYGELCLKPALRGIAKLLSQHGEKELAFRLAGKFITVDPREWQEEFDMTVNVGLGVTDPEQQLMHLMGIEQAQAAAVQGGGMGKLVTPKNLYNLQAKKAELAGFKDVSQFWMDPDTAQPDNTPPPPDPEMVKQQAETEREQMKLQAEHERAVIAAQSAQQIAQYKADSDARVALEKAQIDAMAKIEISKVGALAQPQVNVDNSGGKEELRNGLAEQSGAMAQMFEQLAQAQAEMFDSLAAKMNAPRKVLRDDKGRAIGVQVGDAVMNIVRDENGRASGLQ
jgi:hypothetical protein